MAKELEDMTDEELDQLIAQDESGIDLKSMSEKDIDSLSDDELDEILSDTEPAPVPEKEERKIGIGEKISRALLPEEIVEFSEELKDTEAGRKAKAVQDIQQTVSTFGQSAFLAGATSQLLTRVKQLRHIPSDKLPLLSRESVKADNLRKANNTRRAIQRHAIEGAVAAQPFDYEDLEERIKGTALFSVISPVVGLGFDKGMKATQFLIRRARRLQTKLTTGVKQTAAGTQRDPRLPSITKVKEDIKAQEAKAKELANSVAEEVKKAEEAGRRRIAGVEERATVARERVKATKTAEEIAERRSVQKTKSELDKAVDRMESSLSQEANISSKEFQSKSSGFFGENGQIYGRELDKVSNNISKTGKVTLAEGDAILDNTLKKLGSQPEIVETPLYQEILALKNNKYGQFMPRATSRAGDDILAGLPPDLRAQAEAQARVARDQSKEIPFRELLDDLRGIWKRSYKGNRMTPDGIPGAVLQSEFGEYVATLPGGKQFFDLQRAYRPVISYMNKLSSILKPYRGEAYLKEAEGLVRRVAKADPKSSVTEAELVNFIEKGTENFAKGVGASTARARQVAENIKILKDEMKKQGIKSTDRLLQITEDAARRISKIDSLEKGAVAKVEQEINKAIALIESESANAQSILFKRQAQLGERAFALRSTTEQIRILRKLGVGATTALGGLLSAYVVARGGRELLSILVEGQ